MSNRRSSQWAITRGKAPERAPWQNHSDASEADRDFFGRLREQRGSAAAVRLWRDFLDFQGCVELYPADSLVPLDEDQAIDLRSLRQQADTALRHFAERLEFRSPPEAREFWAVLKSWRVVAGGSARRAFARVATIGPTSEEERHG